MNYSNTYDVIILINEQTRSTCRLQMNMARSPNVFFFWRRFRALFHSAARKIVNEFGNDSPILQL